MPRPDWPRPFTAAFRLFFPLAALAALAGMLRTVLILHGTAVPEGNPFTWHGHEMLFGYAGAAITGFILTAVPNWTGTRPPAGAPLAGLFVLWLVARIGMWPGQPPLWGVAADIAFLPAAALVAAQPIWRAGGGVRRWLPVGVIAAIAGANVLWHLGPVVDAPALPGRALAFATFLIALLIAIIGGRIVPAFTRNHLRAAGATARPRANDLRDTLAIVASAAVAVGELVAPGLVAWLALAAALLHAVRLHGWRGAAVWREPLLFVLHIGYGWLAAGYAVRALALLGPPWSGAWALHGLLVGAIGTMTLAVMARATLGHTGRPLRAGALLTVAFAAVSAAAAIRLLGPVVGPEAWRIAGTLWALAFTLFLVRCGPMCFRARVDAT